VHRSVCGSVRRSVLPCLVLVLLVTAVPLPAVAADPPPGRLAGALSRSVSALWGAIVAQVIPFEWLEKLGPDMDPNGLTTGSCPQAGCEVGPGNVTDLGPEMDPDG
jgi:hypothetical protein